jgi:voltage-gated potassium channel Kch
MKKMPLPRLPRLPAMIAIQFSYGMMAAMAPFVDRCSGAWAVYVMVAVSWSALLAGATYFLPRARGTWGPAPSELFGSRDTYLKTTAIWLVVTFVMGYAACYRQLSLCEPSSFNETLSGVDAIYFALVTLTTVGYGDISPRSQLARAIVTTQLVGVIWFGIFFVGALVSILTTKPVKGSGT